MSNNTIVGTLVLTSTFDCIGVRVSFTGDDNSNNSAIIQYRLTGSSTWIDCNSPIIDRRSTISGNSNSYQNQVRGSIVGLIAGKSYDVQVTISDSDGVTGSPITGSISTLSVSPINPGNTWFVDDVLVNGIGTKESPFNSIPNAISAASAGDRIIVRPGIYSPFTISKSGTSSGWISIIGEDRDNTFISGGAVTDNIVISANYIQIKNFRFKQTLNNSITISSNQHHIWLENLYHENVSSSQSYNDAGILLQTNSHVYILNNTILSPSSTINPPSSPRWDSPVSGIYVLGLNQNIIIKGNTITGGFRDGIGNSPESFGSGLQDSDIVNNIISGTKDDPIQCDGDDINLRIWGNIITADNGYSGLSTESSYVGPVYIFRNLIKLTWTGGSGSALKIGNATYTFYYHNTIIISGGSHDAFAGAVQGQVLKNNIIYSYNGANNPMYNMGDSGGECSYDYNLYYRATGSVLISSWNKNGLTYYTSLSAFNTATGYEAHGINADPQLQGSDSIIDSSSPAYNVGVSLPNFNDSNSNWPAVTTPDIGYYEVNRSLPNTPNNLSIVNGIIYWDFSGVCTNFDIVIDGIVVQQVGVPTPTGNTYSYSLPIIGNGLHTIAVQACNGFGASQSTTIKVAKG